MENATNPVSVETMSFLTQLQLSVRTGRFEAKVQQWLHLENKLLLITINFTPKTSHSCLRKGHAMSSSFAEFCYPSLSPIFWSRFSPRSISRIIGRTCLSELPFPRPSSPSTRQSYTNSCVKSRKNMSKSQKITTKKKMKGNESTKGEDKSASISF